MHTRKYESFTRPFERRPYIKYAKTIEDAELPEINFRNNAGIDLIAAEDASFSTLEDNFLIHTADVKTTIIYDFPPGVHALVAGRSGNAFKRGTVPFYGVIDNSYRGNYMVRLYTHDREVAQAGITKGSAVAQVVILNYSGINLLRAYFKEVSVENLGRTERADRGFGETTGKMV